LIWGLAVVVATARHVLVYDTGPRYNDTVDAGARILVPYLRAAGIGRIDMLVVSHADTDHAGGALSLVRAVAVRVLASSLPRDHPIVLAQAAASVRCAAGMAWTWDDVQFAFVHPAAAAYDEPRRKSNDQSCVLRVATHGGAALLTGDVEAVAEREMLGRAADVAADVLVVPHHGSRTSSTSAFVAAVAPRIAVIAAGYRNRFGHPRADVLERYAQIGAALPRTDRQGAITVSLLPEVPIGVVAERERAARYWYDR
jgi:competence protein ComEC